MNIKNKKELDAARDKLDIEWSIFYNSPLPTCIVGLDGSFLDVNQEWCSLTGYSKTELKTMNFQQITPPDDLFRDLAELETVIASKKKIQSRLIKKYVRKDGVEIEFNLIYNTINNKETQKVEGFVSYAMPITAETISGAITRNKKNLLIILGAITIEIIIDIILAFLTL